MKLLAEKAGYHVKSSNYRYAGESYNNQLINTDNLPELVEIVLKKPPQLRGHGFDVFYSSNRQK